MSRTGMRKPFGTPFRLGSAVKRQVRLGHAERQLVETQLGVQLDLLFGFGGIVHTVGAVDLLADRLDLFLDREFQRIEEFEVAGLSRQP